MRLVARIIEYTKPGRRGADRNLVEEFEMDGSQVMREVVKDFIEVDNIHAQDAMRASVDHIGPNQYMVFRWVNKHGACVVSLATHQKETDDD